MASWQRPFTKSITPFLLNFDAKSMATWIWLFFRFVDVAMPRGAMSFVVREGQEAPPEAVDGSAWRRGFMAIWCAIVFWCWKWIVGWPVDVLVIDLYHRKKESVNPGFFAASVSHRTKAFLSPLWEPSKDWHVQIDAVMFEFFTCMYGGYLPPFPQYVDTFERYQYRSTVTREQLTGSLSPEQTTANAVCFRNELVSVRSQSVKVTSMNVQLCWK